MAQWRGVALAPAVLYNKSSPGSGNEYSSLSSLPSLYQALQSLHSIFELVQAAHISSQCDPDSARLTPLKAEGWRKVVGQGLGT